MITRFTSIGVSLKDRVESIVRDQCCHPQLRCARPHHQVQPVVVTQSDVGQQHGGRALRQQCLGFVEAPGHLHRKAATRERPRGELAIGIVGLDHERCQRTGCRERQRRQLRKPPLIEGTTPQTLIFVIDALTPALTVCRAAHAPFAN